MNWKKRKKKKPRLEDLGARLQDLPKFPDGSPMLPGEAWWRLAGTPEEQFLLARTMCENEAIAETARRDLAELRDQMEEEENARFSR